MDGNNYENKYNFYVIDNSYKILDNGYHYNPIVRQLMFYYRICYHCDLIVRIVLFFTLQYLFQLYPFFDQDEDELDEQDQKESNEQADDHLEVALNEQG